LRLRAEPRGLSTAALAFSRARQGERILKLNISIEQSELPEPPDDERAFAPDASDTPYAEYDARYGDLPAHELTAKTRRARAVTGRRRAELKAGLGDTRKDDEIIFTFKAARFEEEWLVGYLKTFYDDQLITDVLHEVKGGKEATVYCCKAHPRTGTDLLAVKVYRPRKLRNLRNDALYREGRDVLDEEGKAVYTTREQRALAKKTRFGQELRHGSWLGHEYETLRSLHAAGADVPRPVAQSDNAILMEYVGAEGDPAPPLHRVRLEPAEARAMFRRLLRNISLMLANERIHGDLSAYNVLVWNGDVRIIDFPQSVSPHQNPSAYAIFARDVERICQYFARYGIHADAPSLAQQIWKEQLVTDI
jgi:RIO kinase 1